MFVSNSQTQVFTVGHSNHSAETFVSMLQRHQIGAVVDVRSTPYSRFVPQFDRKSLGALLKQANVVYVYMGRELGGRPSEADQYDDHGQVCYRSVAETASFQSGLERVLEGAGKYRVALMCSEEDPLDCHRTLLVAHELWHQDIPVSHIRACSDTYGSYTEEHLDALDRLVQSHGLNQGTLIDLDGSLVHELRSASEIVEQAIDRQRERIAYVDELRTLNDVSGLQE